MDLAGHGRLPRCSVTAVDTRSATNSAFVTEALRLAIIDAVAHRLLPDGFEPVLHSLRDPLDSPDIQRACDLLTKKRACIVLIFDQFEELFSKEQLFETFNAVRELSLDLDARQLPIGLGFAWKTDASLPQQHPAYHLWHQLSDRRRTFKIREFGRRDIQRIISWAEASTGKKLSPAVRARVIEQSQNLPWLLKKLLVHVLQRVSGEESQYIFLERELDVELLFKEDLSVLPEEAVRCLKYVAQRAPVAIADVEENFSRDTTNLLIDSRLLVRSGMNYVVYWDVFRDYLVDGRVPHIPWARTFQRGAAIAVRALQLLGTKSPCTIPVIGTDLGLKEGPAFNLFGDLVALQLVESPSPGLYVPSRHLRNRDPLTVAVFVQGQLRRHVVVKELLATWDKEKPVDAAAWVSFFSAALPRSSSFSTATIHQYANSFKSWLLFAGILEQRDRFLVRPGSTGAQMGLLTVNLPRPALFLGTSAPEKLEALVRGLFGLTDGEPRGELEKRGWRNALADAAAIGIVEQDADARVRLNIRATTNDDAVSEVKRLVAESRAIQITSNILIQGRPARREDVGSEVAAAIGAKWKPGSVKRYGSGLVRFAQWSGRS